MADTHDPASEPSIADLFRSLVDDTQRLVRDEIALARTELTDKARFAAHQSLLVVIGAVLAIVGSVALFAALTLGLAHALTPLAGREAALWISPLLVGLIVGGGGAALLYRGVSRLRSESFTLDKTAQSLKDASHLVKDRFVR